MKRSTTVLEVGCGVGWHAIQHAKRYPDQTYLAVEHGSVRFSKLTRRLKNHPQLTNIRAIQADAERWSLENLSVNDLQAVFIFYPNPYPKSDQARRRWYNRPLMPHLVYCLIPSGQIVMATNILNYAKEYKAKALQLGLVLMSERILPLSSAPRTHFEKKYLLRGEQCTELVFSKPPLTPK